MRSAGARHGAVALGTAICLAVYLGMASAPAGAAVYPGGGGTFTGGAQGWGTVSATCNVPALCTASGGYDGADGNPPGSLSADTNITLNLTSLFNSTVTFVSPDFKVASGGASTLHVDRQFVQGNLVDVAPTATYTATLLDRTSGSQSQVLSEAIDAGAAFTGKDGAATTVAGHTYAIEIEAKTSTTVAGTSLLSGTTSIRFDNVGLAIGTSGGGGGGGGENGAGGSGPSSQQLAALMQGSLVGPAVLKGHYLIVKARCPAKVGVACRLSVQGMLSRKKAATTRRRAKVAKGKVRKFRLKPKARQKVAKAKKLLFKETVKAGKARATVYKRLRLIRR